MKSLAEKYRPQSTHDILGQKNIQRIFELLNDYIAPCYLFYGSPGCGKTSAAKILVSKIENKNIENLNSLSDFIEYNCAMNGGVDQIKELIIDKCNLPPRQLSRKYVILDECQMLSSTSQNSLLQILENPPEFLTFILCTTEPKKLVQALKSRSLQVKFNDAEIPDIIDLLKKVADAEKIKYDDSIEIIAKNSNGSFRESLMLLSQFIKIGATEDNIISIMGSAPESLIKELFYCCFNNDKQKLINTITQILKSNINPDEALKEAFNIVTSEISEKIIGNSTEFLKNAGQNSLVKIDDIIFQHINNINPAVPSNLNFQLCFFKILAFCSAKK